MAKRKPTERGHGQGQDDDPLDLDVTPFLNIMFMLILSILAMTAWTQLAMLNVQAPQIGGGGGTGGAAPETLSTLNLTVFILPDGFNVGASGATLDGNSEGRTGQPLITKVEKTSASGKKSIDYDYTRLQQKLIEIKKTFPDEESMIVSADGNVPYEVVVRVMDAARRSADGKILFPAVAFAAGVVG
ncbi:MAG: biopolymer transporter ExbD [Deltaproteobacteria bacterium]|nr:biopolymer transporter ExbD [Deltaproteobacteria bacterium]